MRKTKLITILSLSVVLIMALTACGASQPYSNIKLDDYIKVGKYKGLEVKSFKVKVTDKDVNEQIKANRQSAQKTEDSKEGTVKKGDTVNIDFVGKIDGKEFEGGTGQGQTLTIGSGQFIDGFETGLIGVKVGDKKTLNLTFPKKYNNKDVAGKDVTFDVTVNSKQISVVPELNEEFVKDQMKNADTKKKVKTVAEYKEYVKDQLKKQKKEEGINEQKSYLWNEVVTASTVQKDDKKKEKYPEEQTKKVEEQITKQYEDYAKQNNMELKDFLEQQMQMDEKTFKQQVKEYAKSVVKEDMIVMAIAEKEGIEVSSDEYDKFIADQLKSYGYTEESYKEQTGKTFEEANGEESIMAQIYKDKVLDFILDNAKVVDKLSKK